MCNSRQQLVQHTGSAGCKIRKHNLQRLQCVAERSVFIANIPLDAGRGELKTVLEENSIVIDDDLESLDEEVKASLGGITDPSEVFIEMRQGSRCQYAVVQLKSVDERAKAISLTSEETDTVLIIRDAVLDIKPYRARVKNFYKNKDKEEETPDAE